MESSCAAAIGMPLGKHRESLRGRKGFGTTDMLLALVVFAVVIGGIMFFYVRGTSMANVSSMRTSLSQAVSNIKNLHSGMSYGALTPGQMRRAGVFPDSLFRGSGESSTLVNPWGGQITYAVEADGNGFSFTLTQLPPDACIELYRMDLGWYQVGDYTRAAGTVPVSAANALASCGASTSTNSVKFYSH